MFAWQASRCLPSKHQIVNDTGTVLFDWVSTKGYISSFAELSQIRQHRHRIDEKFKIYTKMYHIYTLIKYTSHHGRIHKYNHTLEYI